MAHLLPGRISSAQRLFPPLTLVKFSLVCCPRQQEEHKSCRLISKLLWYIQLREDLQKKLLIYGIFRDFRDRKSPPPPCCSFFAKRSITLMQKKVTKQGVLGQPPTPPPLMEIQPNQTHIGLVQTKLGLVWERTHNAIRPHWDLPMGS